MKPPKGYTWNLDTLRYQGCIILVHNSTLKQIILEEFHSSPTIGHSRFYKTYERAKCSFFWEGMKNAIHYFVVTSNTCQRHKGEMVNTLVVLQLLPIPTHIRVDNSMDFIMGLLRVGNKSVFMVVVDCPSKYAHFCTLAHPFTLSLVSQVFLDKKFKLHGMPNSIILDQDPTFTSKF